MAFFNLSRIYPTRKKEAKKVHCAMHEWLVVSLLLNSLFQVAENIKEFFHNEGIHSTTIQPEFVDYHPNNDSGNGEDCILSCPKGPGSLPAPNCEASKCCKPAIPNGNAKRASRSAQNTPTSSRRPTSFTENEVENNKSLQSIHNDEEEAQPLHDRQTFSSTSW